MRYPVMLIILCIVVATCPRGLSAADAAPGPRTINLTDGDNGKTFFPMPGDTIVVDLPSNPGTGYSWLTVQLPNDPWLTLVDAHMAAVIQDRAGIGRPQLERFTYRVPESAPVSTTGTSAEWLTLISTRPWEPKLGDYKLWQVKLNFAHPN